MNMPGSLNLSIGVTTVTDNAPGSPSSLSPGTSLDCRMSRSGCCMFPTSGGLIAVVSLALSTVTVNNTGSSFTSTRVTTSMSSVTRVHCITMAVAAVDTMLCLPCIKVDLTEKTAGHVGMGSTSAVTLATAFNVEWFDHSLSPAP